MAWKKDKLAARKEREIAPPPAVIPWRVPPMGSLGDAWDDAIELPHVPAPAEQTPARKKKPKIQPGSLDVVFVEWKPKLHATVIIAWILLAMAMLTTGPAYPLMGFVALAGLLTAILAIFMLRAVHRDHKGEPHAWAAVGAGILLLTLDAWQPEILGYQTYFRETVSRPLASLTFEERLIRAENDMEFLAKVAYCASLVLENETTAVGRNSLNRRVDGDSIYFRISTLSIQEGLSEISKEYIFYAIDTIPRDPFADDSRATYGIYLTADHIIVYSAGPDGVWDIDPIEPVDLLSEDPESELAPMRMDKNLGEQALGDIIHVFPMPEVEADGPSCEEVRRQYVERDW